jgi:hypothetical protein
LRWERHHSRCNCGYDQNDLADNVSHTCLSSLFESDFESLTPKRRSSKVKRPILGSWAVYKMINIKSVLVGTVTYPVQLSVDPDSRDETFSLVITGLFFAAIAIGIAHHSMWRDELQAWTISRESTSLFSLYRNTRYEGHPLLWHLCLMLLSRVTRSPWIMQVFQCLIATATVFIFTRYAPFPRLARALFPLGYYPLFEYGIIARGYPLGTLLLVVFCVWMSKRPGRFAGAAVWLVLLANSNPYGFVLAVSCSVYVFSGLWKGTRTTELAPARKAERFLIPILVMAIGFSIALISALPANDGASVDTRLNERGFLLDGAKHLSEAEINSFVPLGPGTRKYWTTDWLLYHTDRAHVTPVLFGIAAAFAALFLIVIARDRRALALYLVGTSGLLVLMHISYPFLRHEGSVYLMRLATLWLSASVYADLPFPTGKDEIGAVRKLMQWLRGLEARYVLLMLMLSLQAIMGIVAFADSFRRPFSNAREIATFISQSPYSTMPLVAYRPDFLASGVGAYLDRPMFFIEGKREGRFIIWDGKRALQPPTEDASIAWEFMKEHQNGALFVGPADSLPPFNSRQPVKVKLLASFNGDSISGEDLAVYVVSINF